MAEPETCLARQKIAYFSMEIGLSNNIHTYNGGLGILAGDSVKWSADLKVPLVGITLVSKKGHFKQELTSDGKQVEHPDPWEPSEYMQLLSTEVTVQIQKRCNRQTLALHSQESNRRGCSCLLSRHWFRNKQSWGQRDYYLFVRRGWTIPP